MEEREKKGEKRKIFIGDKPNHHQRHAEGHF
jgi:hypothetical protein